jgi:hypothetical protein
MILHFVWWPIVREFLPKLRHSYTKYWKSTFLRTIAISFAVKVHPQF